MQKKFIGFLGYTKEEFEYLWENAIFVPDTNILLNFYRYQANKTTTTFLDILKSLKEDDRLWIPHQVVLEYFLNYKEIMNKDKEGYAYLKDELQKINIKLKKALNKSKDKYNFLDFNDYNQVVKDVENCIFPYLNSLKEKMNQNNKSESIKQELNNLMDGIVGDPFDKEILNDIHLKGKQRYKSEIPPGFLDEEEKNKQGKLKTYGVTSYEKQYGDLILWKQMIDKSRISGQSIIFITEDQKNDWWEEEGGKKKGPLPSLIQEFYDKTGKYFYMYSTNRFIKFAKEYLSINITEDEYKDLKQDVDEIRKRDSVGLLKDCNVEDINREFFNVNINSILKYLSKDEEEILKRRIKEIFSNKNLNRKSNAYKKLLKRTIVDISYAIEEKTHELLAEITTLDYDASIHYLNKLDNLPENRVKRTMELLNLNDEMNYWLLDNLLPF